MDISIEENEAQRMAALESALDQMARRGELADGGFCEVMRDNLAEPMADLFDAYRKALSDWPEVIAEEEDFSIEVETEEGTVTVADRLGGIRHNTTGERARIVLESSALVDDKGQYRPTMALQHWVRHLAHHLAGGPITTLIISKKGSPTLKPLDPATARELLMHQIQAWSTGMTRPLPFAVNTATTWLKKPGDAPATYEGGYNFKGEVEKDACLRRAYPDYASLTASDEFETLAHQLIEPLVHAMTSDKGKQKKTTSHDTPIEGEA